jgi:subtilisin family serine protease
MPQSWNGRTAFVVTGLLVVGLGSGRSLTAQELSAQAMRQVQDMLAEKAARTPAQRKLATSLLYAQREALGQAMVQGLGSLRRTADRARVDDRGRVVVDIKGTVTENLLQGISAVGGELISSYPEFGAVRARVPIRRIEELAALAEVRLIRPETGFLVNAGTVTSQGDAAHAAAAARTTHGINGTGIKVGVLSDGVSSLAARQATADLPPNCPAAGACVTVLPGQAGTGDEGTAMLEIVHDLAPGAKLFFATANGGPATFAANILALRNTHGCDVIVDDITYPDEGAFQDGTIAQAVNTVTASGALFFSSAGNSGRMSAGTSGTWEGDFLNSGTAIPTLPTFEQGRPIHSFNGLTGGGAANSDQLTANAPFFITLQWSDPLGGATADYDLFMFNSTLTTVVDGSADDNLVSGNPFEIMGPANSGERVVIVLFAGGPTRALRLDTFRGRLGIATAGSVFGHNGGNATLSVAAAAFPLPGTGPFTGGAANPIETYSSDGPRRIFYNPNGSAITPGNILFGTNGGRTLLKPDITGADCVATTTPGFTPQFCGTSAAAPHVAAIAALVKSATPAPTGAQVQAALFASALDVNPPGQDRDAGVGIAMANRAMRTLIGANFFTVNPCRVIDTRLPGGPTAGAPLTCGSDRSFTIVGGTCGLPAGVVKAVALNVTVTDPSAVGNLRLFAAGDPAPVVSTVNYAAGQTRGNNSITPVSPGGQIAARCAPSGTTHMLVDVYGYFQ